MGIVVNEVAFEGRAPQLSDIADKITELSGLPLSVTESGADVKGDLFDLHGYLAFACAAEQPLEIYAYRGRAVRDLCEEMFGNVRLPMTKCVQGINEPAGTQSVYLTGYLGQEPTLLVATTLALEALGGRPKYPIGDEARREYGTPITPAQLEERRRKVAKQMRSAVMVGLLLLPVIIPLWIVGLVVMMPWSIWKAYKLYRAWTEGSGSSAEPGSTDDGAASGPSGYNTSRRPRI